jgi:hypothetical protein
MSIFHPSSHSDKDVEFGATASNRGSCGTQNGEVLSFEDLTKDEASKKGSKEELTSQAVEGGRNESGLPGKEDPFGNEEDSDVKYKTMAWWYIHSVCFTIGPSQLTVM